MAVTQKEIQQSLSSLGLEGAPICVHASLRSFGSIEGGTISLINAFLEIESTLLVPTFSLSFEVPPLADELFPRNGWNYAAYAGPTSGLGRSYAPQTNEVDETMGKLAKAVLAHPDRVRGNHPICSFSAIGPRASELIDEQSPDDVYAPLKTLADLGGFVLLIGVELDRLTLLHLAEKQAGRKLFRRWANDQEGRVVTLETGGCSTGFLHLEDELRAATRVLTVGQSKWKLISTRQALERASAAIRANPAITHCGSSACPFCDDAVAGGPVMARGT